MSEGEVDVGTTDAGGGDAAAAAAATTTTTKQTDDWRAGFSADIRDNPVTQRLENAEAGIRELIGAQTLLGGEKMPRPTEDWTEEQWNDHHTKLGRPAEVGDYDLTGVEIPEDLPWDDGFQTSMVGAMHKEGLSQKAVKNLFDAYVAYMGPQNTEALGAAVRGAETATQDLRNEWGSSYEARVEIATNALRAAAGDQHDTIRFMKLADGTTIGSNPTFVKMLANLGDKMTEHGLVGATTKRVTLTPAEATQKKNQLMADGEFFAKWRDGSHLEHDAAVKQINDLIAAEGDA